MMRNELESKPLVSILMAVYKPNEIWLVEQLKSLNEQDYDNVELIIWDDCPEHPTEERFFQTYITNMEYTLIRGEKNLGSNGAFEELTRRANGAYISYCDQDDIWNSNKVSVMLNRLMQTKAVLVCCDQYIIDENGTRTADSIVEIRKRHTWRSGTGLAKYLIADNFVTGCALIMDAKIAKEAVPFEKTMVHDQWLGLVGALHGSIEVVMEPLIGYRQHSSNQTGILLGVKDKQTYYQWRIEYFLKRAQAVRARLSHMEMVQEEVEDVAKDYEAWMLARQRFFYKQSIRDYRIIWAGKQFGKPSVMVESILPFIPEWIFKKMINMAQRGIL